MNFTFDTIFQLWFYGALAVGIVMAVLLIRNWKNYSWNKRLITLAIIIFIWHIWEEGKLPGGFNIVYNITKDNYVLDRYPMNELVDMLTNLSGIVYAVLAWKFWPESKKSSMTICVVAVVECIAHVRLCNVSIEYFGSWYAPGIISCIFGFLPISIAFIVWFIKDHPRVNDYIATVFLSLFVLLTSIIGTEAIFKSPTSPYSYPDAGYYEQYDYEQYINESTD